MEDAQIKKTIISQLRRLDIRPHLFKQKKEKEPVTTDSRIISKNGRVQLHLNRISLGKRQRYWRNPLTTLLGLRWRWIMSIFGIGFILTWVLFAVIYYIIASLKGDLEPNLDEDHSSCVVGVNSFTAAFLFSVETQHTIGYGSRHTNPNCNIANMFVFLQFIVGVAVQCLVAGLVVAKLQLGKRCSKSVLFSQRACIGYCDNAACLMVRVGSSGKARLVGVTGYGLLIERELMESGEEILTETYLQFQSENNSEVLNLLWPAVLHCAVEKEPLEFIQKLKQETSELIVSVQGVLESTGQSFQFRTSYVGGEIDVGRQFVDISPSLVLTGDGQGYYHELDYADFHETQEDPNWCYSEQEDQAEENDDNIDVEDEISADIHADVNGNVDDSVDDRNGIHHKD